MKSAVTSLILFAASLAHATNFMVAVGVGGLTFNPTSVTANAGDTIEFVVTGAHDITEADFSSPCRYKSGGAFSGISPSPNFVITVADSSPRFFYCSVDDHCLDGMVFALNPTESESFASFQSAANSFTGNSETPPGGATGGTIGSAPAGGSSSSSPSSPPPATSSSSSPPPITSSASSPPASTSSSATQAGSSASAATTKPATTASSVGSVLGGPIFEQLLGIVGCALFAAWYFF